MAITLSMLGRAWRARRAADATETAIMRTAGGEGSWNRLGGPDAAIAADIAADMLGALLAAHRGTKPPPCVRLDILDRAETWAATLPETELDETDGRTCLALAEAGDRYQAEIERGRLVRRPDGRLAYEGLMIQKAATTAYNEERRRILDAAKGQ